jgi:hypothetical protein
LPASCCNQVEAAHPKSFSDERLGKVAYGHDAAPTKNHAVDLGSAMSETE